jgi:excinuclease ABC subunit C
MWHAEHAFEGFGPDPLDPHGPRVLEEIGRDNRAELRSGVRERAPKAPGIYGMLDREDRLIYVGKSKNLRARLLSYFSTAVAAEKAGRIIETTRRIVVETQPSEFAALLREQQLIRRWTPRWNVQEIPKRQRPVYLCLGRGPAATFFLSRLPPANTIACEGPFHGAGRMSRAVDALNTFFRLRDCKNSTPFSFSNQLPLFEIEQRAGCLRHEIGTCSGPCAGAVSLEGYQRQITQARSFLDGFNDEPLVTIQEQMERAATDLNFEHAAKLRDDWKAMHYLYRKLVWLAEARRRYTFIYSVPGCAGDHTWYFIRSGEICEAAAAPATPPDYARARPLIRRWRSEAEHDSARGHGPYPHTLSLVASWFSKHNAQLERTFPPHEAGRKYRRMARSAVA